jgi:TPR repeat protein
VSQGADQGDAYAQYNIGVLYRDGSGMAQNFTEAANWFRKAADRGNAHAKNCSSPSAINAPNVHSGPACFETDLCDG